MCVREKTYITLWTGSLRKEESLTVSLWFTGSSCFSTRPRGMAGPGIRLATHPEGPRLPGTTTTWVSLRTNLQPFGWKSIPSSPGTFVPQVIRPGFPRRAGKCCFLGPQPTPGSFLQLLESLKLLPHAKFVKKEMSYIIRIFSNTDIKCDGKWGARPGSPDTVYWPGEA